ncbi:MAG: CDP-diacylglycerol--glycerol-3-phosphate 3-phosphatidyltransferase [Pirellulaceae bacterium]|nr:CDP-diacylglycerol--glycerol-3-phosphate 3-phosphatidyltransferase [Pirellulaceae bacterium]
MSASTQVWNVPNQITMTRLVLSVVVCVLIPCGQYLAAMIVFIIAAGTDAVDGYLARRWQQVTQLGRVLDPLVDKVIISGAFILLAEAMRDMPVGIRGWMAVIVVVRELVVTALRSLIEQRGGDFSAKMSGKLKMVFQCVAVVAALVLLMVVDRELPAWLNQTLWWTMLVSAWLAVLSTVQSGVGYVLAAIRILRT